MRHPLAFAFFFILASLVAGCSSDESVEHHDRILSTLQSNFPAGTLAGKTAEGTRCEVRVRHGVGSPREFTLELLVDDDPSVTTFYANGGRTLTLEGGVGMNTDVTAKADGVEPHVWELRSRRDFVKELYEFIEVEESGGGATTTRRCFDVAQQ
jgi:hypothetical protein